MDGLSILGLVCEQEKQMICDGHHSQSKVQTWEPEENLSGNGTDLAKVKEESDETLDLDVLCQDFDESIDDISVKEEKSDDVCDSDDVKVITNLESKNTTYEKSSQALATHLNINDFGHFIFKIQENQLCKFSKYTGWHLQRSTGMMKIKVTFRNIKIRGPLIVRAVLVRKDVTYRHFGVDRICEQHRTEVSLDTREHVLQAAPGLEGMWYFGDGGPRKSVCFNIGSPDVNGSLEETIGLKCICNDSCSTCDDASFKQTESSRDLLLVLTLESREFGVVLARRSILIWPKAVVRPKDLNKPERRKPKGGAAKLNKIREMLEKPKPSDDNTKNVDSHVIKKIVPNTQTEKEFLRLAPKLATVGHAKILGSSSVSKINILLQVDSKNGIPTSTEILESTINYAVKNAKTLGLSKTELLEKIASQYDKL